MNVIDVEVVQPTAEESAQMAEFLKTARVSQPGEQPLEGETEFKIWQHGLVEKQ
jgi:hypothetical protein